MSLCKATYIFIEEDISTMERIFSLLTQQINAMCFNKVLVFLHFVFPPALFQHNKRLWQKHTGEDDCSKIWLIKKASTNGAGGGDSSSVVLTKGFEIWSGGSWTTSFCQSLWEGCKANLRVLFFVFCFVLISEVAMLLHIATSK